MKGFERMREMKINHGLHRLASLTLAMLGMVWAANAATGTSEEFRMDLSGMGPWEMRTAAASEAISYSSTWATNTLDGAKAVVKVYPVKREKPKYIAIDLSGGTTATHYPIEYLDEIPGGSWSDEYKTSKLVLRHIPAGSFIMGGRNTDYPGAVNTNLHMVTLTKDFYMGVFEVTQRQWELVMGNRPSAFSNETCYATRPVDYVSHDDMRGAVLGRGWPNSKEVDTNSFIGKIRMKSGLVGLDLPTEAQWEYACRAGTVTALNNGKNITASTTSCPNAASVARYVGNSNSGQIEQNITRDMNFALDVGTAKSGSYEPNKWGLYDMHGNVWEVCLDCDELINTASIDPVGSLITNDWRQIRGGGYRNTAEMLRSGDHHKNTKGKGVLLTWAANDTGFRLCLQGGEIPEVVDGVELVNAAGVGTANWMPTKAGIYYLTHETQTNGVNGAEVLGAWFTVDAPELCISALGELTNGVAVKVEKVGGGGEWAVYYSLDGSEPTAGSTKYEGPFALPASATVKAVAISAGGVTSEVASTELALHPALAVEDTKARQRYPWNGKVDIDCEITGDATKKYAVTFSVEDEIGHTNLPIRTVGADVLGGPQPQNNENALDGGSGVPGGHALPFVLSPGKYRFVWDAAADLPKGIRFGEVSVSIDAEPSPLADWKREVTISTDGYAGSETLSDVPVLVRLSSAIEGFDYADFAAPDTGADMIFTDMEGVARYPYEIDEWHKGGESLVWVKLPELRKGTKFKLAYGNAQYAIEQSNNPNNRTLATHEVWRDYAGVWHMNEDSGTAFDSTEHGLDALPSCGTNKLADVSQMVAYENGACGRARVNATQHISAGNYMCVPSYSALGITDKFVVSGWFHTTVFSGADLMIGRMYNNTVNGHGYSSKGGWHIETWSKPEGFVVCGSTNHTGYVIAQCSDMQENWVSLAIVYSGSVAKCYANGELVNTGTIVNPTDNGLPLTFGCTSNAAGGSYAGQYDEIRLRGGSLSADRIKADYDMIANRDFCTYGKVEAGPGAEPVPPSVHSAVVTFNPNGGTLVGQSLVIYKGDSVVFGTMPTATKDGYSFRGWGRTADATEVVKSTDIVPDSGCELFAVWDELTYTVKFNANGGTGTMADEVFEVGVAKALTANAFKRTGYTFQGWATSTDGEVEYSDKQSVVNLTTSGSTVNLFAIWKGIVPVVNGLIAYWPFNGDINDYSGNSHHLSGTVSYGNDRNGVSKSAATFTGSAFLTQKTDLGVTGSMTFSCWVGSPTYTVSRDDIEMYLAAVGRGNFGQHWVYWPLIVFPASVTDGRGVGFSVAANRINVFANGEWFNVILDYSCDISSGWHHVAVTIGTSNSPVLYLDGVKVKEGSSAWNGFVPKLSNANTIGGGDYRAGGKYKGQLDDLCIYNRILSANEIKALHDAR